MHEYFINTTFALSQYLPDFDEKCVFTAAPCRTL